MIKNVAKEFIEFSSDNCLRRIAYKDYNFVQNEDFCLFCAHALGRNSSDFDYLASYISDYYRVVSVDFSGHGDSTYLDNWKLYTYDFFLKDLTAVCKKLSIKKIAYLGSSLGGIIGIIACSENKGLIKSLILNDIGPSTPKVLDELVAIDPQKLIKSYSFNSYEDCKTKLMKTFNAMNFNFQSNESRAHVIENSIVEYEEGSFRIKFDPMVFKLVDNSGNKMRSDGFWKEWGSVNVPIMEIYGAKSSFINDKIISDMKVGKDKFVEVKCLESGHVCSLDGIDQMQTIKKWLDGDLSEDLVLNF